MKLGLLRTEGQRVCKLRNILEVFFTDSSLTSVQRNVLQLILYNNVKEKQKGQNLFAFNSKKNNQIKASEN